MPLRYGLPYLPLTNEGRKRRDWAYLVPVDDGRSIDLGLPRMRDVFNNFTVQWEPDGKLLVTGPFTQGYYMLWVYGDLADYDPKKHFFSDYTVSQADLRSAAFLSGAWRVPGPVQGPWFFNFYGMDGRPPYVRVSGDCVSGGDNLLTFNMREMKEGRFNGELLIEITNPGVPRLTLDGSEMGGMRADTITLEPVDLEERHRVKMCPLPERVRTHPRLYFDAEELERRREARHTNGNSPVYAELLELIERAVAGAESKEAGLWHPEGRERIFETDRLVLCAFGYLMERDERYLRAAVESLEQIVGEDYEWPGVDNQVAMVIGALAAGYDWLYHELTEEQRKRTEKVLVFRAEEGYRMKLMDRYHRQNHFMHTAFFSVGVTALVLWEKFPEKAHAWGHFARTSMERALAMSPDDGSCMVSWNYDMVSMVPFAEMIRQTTGEDLFARDPYFRNAGIHWLYKRIGDWRSHEDWDPASRNTRNECAWIYRWASAFDDPVLQWAADGIRPILLDRTDWRFAQPQRRVFEYLWRDPDLEPQPPGPEETARHFPDAGFTVFRTGWGRNDLVFDTRCGPLLGHVALTQGELGSYGHSPPHQNSIHLFACGEDLLSRRCDTYGLATKACSTVLVDGCGQTGNLSFFGDGGPQMPCETGYSRHFIHTEGFDYVEGVATPVYPRDLKLRNFTRRTLFLRPELFVIVDELAADVPRLFQWRLSSEGTFSRGKEESRFILEKGSAALDILVAGPPRWSAVLGETPTLANYCADLVESVNYLGIEAPHTVFETTFVTILAPRPLESPVRDIETTVTLGDDTLTVHVVTENGEWTIAYGFGDDTEKRVAVARRR
jgi:hypothetical protein